MRAMTRENISSYREETRARIAGRRRSSDFTIPAERAQKRARQQSAQLEPPLRAGGAQCFEGGELSASSRRRVRGSRVETRRARSYTRRERGCVRPRARSRKPNKFPIEEFPHRATIRKSRLSNCP
ncbi:uncharacterized protein MICPUCDRAFT_65096 [Micromonas pusilla CCMP1545]|uniref:Predicted protein n=1 Tax=Micromonas pusilla (strain CCMP1545) TaxID=564608 RepID=C1MLK5_MICPC|nr:uncharacterized protein MICPUCDRAFT_65096 [Micromonas pusilla CCMP1545]EEH59957.1 predicted protein [Micromonas pusilla CCMP1545]|eukprot:XP_003056581.1 predicted protein [Micromonas pusilla CCMP1545]